MKIKEMLGALQIDKLLDRGAVRHNQLMTAWGESIESNQLETVLTEYPRPQMARRNYTILNGIWKYAFSQNADFPTAYDGTIRVPFSPETVLSGVQRQLNPGEYLWYEREIEIDRIPKAKRLLLQFGACDERCRVYINGRIIANAPDFTTATACKRAVTGVGATPASGSQEFSGQIAALTPNPKKLST